MGLTRMQRGRTKMTLQRGSQTRVPGSGSLGEQLVRVRKHFQRLAILAALQQHKSERIEYCWIARIHLRGLLSKGERAVEFGRIISVDPCEIVGSNAAPVSLTNGCLISLSRYTVLSLALGRQCG